MSGVRKLCRANERREHLLLLVRREGATGEAIQLACARFPVLSRTSPGTWPVADLAVEQGGLEPPPTARRTVEPLLQPPLDFAGHGREIGGLEVEDDGYVRQLGLKTRSGHCLIEQPK